MVSTIDKYTNNVYQADALEFLKKLPDESIDCSVTSPPYWNLRDYEAKGQLGLENTFVEYINNLCDIFDEIKRVLKPEGTIWVNIGDTYYGSTKRNPLKDVESECDNYDYGDMSKKERKKFYKGNRIVLPRKSLAMIPGRFAIEMLNRGWCLRNNIIWHKPAIMPRPIKERFTIDFENVFFFTKNETYYFKTQYEKMRSKTGVSTTIGTKYEHENLTVSKKSMHRFAERIKDGKVPGRIKRAVWNILPSRTKSYHLAPYPEELIIPMIDAGCPENGIVLDPFIGTGTTAIVALKQGKRFIGIDIDETAVSLTKERVETFLDQQTIFDRI